MSTYTEFSASGSGHATGVNVVNGVLELATFPLVTRPGFADDLTIQVDIGTKTDTSGVYNTLSMGLMVLGVRSKVGGG